MRHRWKKAKNCSVIDGKGKREVKICQECIHCGLRKGEMKMNTRWPYTYNYYTFIYFKDGKILSKNKLPYKCIKKHEFFLTEEDFLI